MEWIKINLPFGPIYDKNLNQLDSFCKRELNQAGTVIEVRVKRKTSQYLIGDINELSGVCDDCTMFEREDIVTRYRIIDWK